MDSRLVRVVCSSCDANYRIAADSVRGKVVDYCCSNCGAVIEVNGTAIELVAPTRPGQDPRERLPRTPEPAIAEPSESAFRVNAPPWRSDTPAGFVRVKPPSPPTAESFAAAQRTPVHSSMPPPMSMPSREVVEIAARTSHAPPERLFPPPPPEEQHSHKAWWAAGTLAAAIAVAFLARTLASADGEAPAAAAQPPPAQNPIASRLQASDFRGTVTDPSAPQANAVPAPPLTSSPVSVESLKAEKKKKKKNSTTGTFEEISSDPLVEATPSAPAQPQAEAPAAEAPPTPTFVAPEPPPPAGPEFSKDAAQAALEDAAALAATCRQEDTTAGAVRVAVTFVPSGQATVAVVESGVVRGTPVGSCVASKFRTAKVPPFSGPKVTVHKTMMF